MGRKCRQLYLNKLKKKRNELLMYTTIWIDLQEIICEISQTEEGIYAVIPCTQHFLNDTVFRKDNRLMVFRGEDFRTYMWGEYWECLQKVGVVLKVQQDHCMDWSVSSLW